MKKILILLMLCFTTLTFAQTSKEEIAQIIKEQSDGIPNEKVTGSTVYNDGKKTVKQVYNDAKAFSPKIEKAVESLAGSLKTTANQLWNILVKQQFVWSCAFLILTIASLFNWCIFWKRLNKTENKQIEFETLERDQLIDIPNPDFDQYIANRQGYENNPKSQTFIKGTIGAKEQYLAPKIISTEDPKGLTMFQIIHLLICIAISGLSFWHFTDMLTGFINPEYGALKTILEVANNLK